MKAWDTLLALLDHKLGEAIVNKWVRTLKIEKFDARNLYLDASNSFQINWFDEYVSPFLSKHFVTGSGKPIKIHFTINRHPLKNNKEQINKETEYFSQDILEQHATLNAFVITKSDNLAFNIFNELIDSTIDMSHYNPIYICGPKGSGKSHLLMGTAKELIKIGKKCFYVRSETFTDHVIRAFRLNKLHEFRNSYRDIDVLLIDDVHLFARKIATQEELFHTFNRLHTHGKQIIVSSNYTPRNLEEIEERLISRFEWGITLPITPPTIEEKMIIITKRAKQLSLSLDILLKQFLLTHFKNLHSLIQAIEALALRYPDSAKNIDSEIAKFYLKDLLQKESKETLIPEKILKIVANTFGIKIEDILGKSQNKESTFPRQIAMYLCRNKLQLSYLKIGRIFSRDHSTAMTSIKRIKKGIEGKEKAVLLSLADIERMLN